MFWISAVLLVFVMAMVLFPGLMANAEKTSSLSGGCKLTNSLLPPSSEYWFGTDQLGCDVYSLSIYGARPSVTVGLIAAVVTTLIGGAVGLFAGFYGGRVDSILSRIVDVFFGLPTIVVGIAALSFVSPSGDLGRHADPVHPRVGQRSAHGPGADHRGEGPGLHDGRTRSGGQQRPRSCSATSSPMRWAPASCSP